MAKNCAALTQQLSTTPRVPSVPLPGSAGSSPPRKGTPSRISTPKPKLASAAGAARRAQRLEGEAVDRQDQQLDRAVRSQRDLRRMGQQRRVGRPARLQQAIARRIAVGKHLLGRRHDLAAGGRTKRPQQERPSGQDAADGLFSSACSAGQSRPDAWELGSVAGEVQARCAEQVAAPFSC